MFGFVAVEKEIYARETAQLCVGAGIRKLMLLRKSADTCHIVS